tara:strand:+ start:4909 stop:5136 length:228 start_codon:yes stop_codon:yes gene_type:complete
MIEWFRKFFRKARVVVASQPKCSKCGLLATKEIKIEFIKGGNTSTIVGSCCDSCEEELSRDFNPLWIPPLVLKEK